MFNNKIRFTLTLFISLLYCAECEEHPSIVIIGSGPSGIAAATRLLKNNFTNIKILEAENRIGGRIYSVKFGDAFVDLGAEWCHGQENNIVHDMVKDMNILRHTQYNYVPITSNGKTVNDKFLDDLFKFIESVYEDDELEPWIVEKCSKENSVGKCFKTLFNSSFVSKFKDEQETKLALGALYIIRGYVSGLESSLDWDDVALSGSEYEVCKGDQNLNWNGLGSKTILEVLMQKYPPGQQPLAIDQKFILNKEVVDISNWDTKEKATKIKCGDGATFGADHVIFTPSLGVLKANYSTLFKPELPSEKVNAIENIGFGAIAKVIMHFPERWWDGDLTWIALWTPEDVSNLKNDFKGGVTENGKPWLTYLVSLTQAENNPNVLIAWFVADIFPELEELSDEVVLDGLKYFLRRFLGNKYNITDPDRMLRTKWYTNPHFRGTYSYESVKGHPTGVINKLRDQLAAPLLTEDGDLSVQFAGEATNAIHFATVQGAIESGYREADRIINLHKNSNQKALRNSNVARFG